MPALECLLWACNVREGPARPLDMSHTTPEVERLRLTLPGDPPSSSCFYHVSWLSPQVELLGGRVGPGTQWTVMGGVAPPWEQARQLDISPWDPGRSAGYHPLGWGCHLVIAP